MLFSTLPLYVKYLGGNNFDAGLVTSLYSFSALLFRPVFGNLMDKKGRKIILIIGSIILVIVTLSYNVIYSVILLLIFRFINGIAFSANTTAAGAVVADLVPPSRLSQGIGILGVTGNFATAIGPAIGLYIIGISGYSIFFISVVLISIFSFASSMFLNYERDKRKNINKSTEDSLPIALSESKQGLMFEKTSLLPSLVMFFIMLGVCTVTTFVPPYAQSLGIENISVFYIIYAFSTMVIRVAMDKYEKHFGVKKVFSLGILMLFFSYLALTFKSFNMIMLAGILYGFGFGIVFPVVYSIVMELCPIERRGLASATFYSAMDIAMVLGGAIWGIVSDLAGFKAIFLGGAAFTLIAFGVFISMMVKNNSLVGKQN